MMSISAHFNFVRSIENPAGFAMALDNIQRIMGGFSLPGPVIVRQSEKLTVDHDPLLASSWCPNDLRGESLLIACS